MSHQYCWLCECDLLKGSMNAKRKKIHGDATKSTVKLLESISLDYLGKIFCLSFRYTRPQKLTVLSNACSIFSLVKDLIKFQQFYFSSLHDKVLSN